MEKKICIVGLGAIGGWMAGRLGLTLPPGAVQLSAVARGATLQAVQAQGGLLVTDAAGIRKVPLQVHDDPLALGVQDLLIVAVKAPALAAVAPVVQALCGPHTQVLAAMNGVPWWFFDGLPGRCAGLQLQAVDPEGVARRCLPAAQVVGCVVHASCSAPAPGSVRHVKGDGLVIGLPQGGRSAALDELATLLAQVGFGVTVSERIQREVWFKLWGNMTLNPISALTGASCDHILDDELLRAHCTAVMHEAQAVGAAFGITIEETPEARQALTRRMGSFKTSMLQDTEAGRPLELDAMLGAVREIGRHLGLATPNIDTLYGLTRLMARQRGLYPPA